MTTDKEPLPEFCNKNQMQIECVEYRALYAEYERRGEALEIAKSAIEPAISIYALCSSATENEFYERGAPLNKPEIREMQKAYREICKALHPKEERTVLEPPKPPDSCSKESIKDAIQATKQDK